MFLKSKVMTVAVAALVQDFVRNKQQVGWNRE